MSHDIEVRSTPTTFKEEKLLAVVRYLYETSIEPERWTERWSYDKFFVEYNTDCGVSETFSFKCEECGQVIAMLTHNLPSGSDEGDPISEVMSYFRMMGQDALDYMVRYKHKLPQLISRKRLLVPHGHIKQLARSTSSIKSSVKPTWLLMVFAMMRLFSNTEVGGNYLELHDRPVGSAALEEFGCVADEELLRKMKRGIARAGSACRLRFTKSRMVSLQ